MSIFSPSSTPRGTEKRNLSPFEKLRNALSGLFGKRFEYAKTTPNQSMAISVQNINWADTPGVNYSTDDLAVAQTLSDGAIRERAEAYSQRRIKLQQKAAESQASAQSKIPAWDSRVIFEWRGRSFAPPSATSERTATQSAATLYPGGIPKAPRVPAAMQQGPAGTTSLQKATIPFVPIDVTPTLYGVGIPASGVPGDMQQHFESAERIGSRPRTTQLYEQYTPSADAFPPKGLPQEPYEVAPSFALGRVSRVRNSVERVLRFLPGDGGTVSMIERRLAA